MIYYYIIFNIIQYDTIQYNTNTIPVQIQYNTIQNTKYNIQHTKYNTLIYLYIYTYIYIHTYIYTHTYIFVRQPSEVDDVSSFQELSLKLVHDAGFQ